MQNNKFLAFLLLSLALTAFLAGYILVGQEVKDDGHHSRLAMVPIVKTGTLLDRFAEQNTNNYSENNLRSPTSTPKVRSLRNLTALNSNISSYAFSPDGSRVAYFIYQKNKNGNFGAVFVSNSDGSNPQILLKTRVPVVTLSWIVENEVSVEIDPLKEPIVLRITSD